MKTFVQSLIMIICREKLKASIDAEFDKKFKEKDKEKIDPKTLAKIKQQPNSEFISIGMKQINAHIEKLIKQNKLDDMNR